MSATNSIIRHIGFRGIAVRRNASGVGVGFQTWSIRNKLVKVKVIPQQAEVAQWVPGRLRRRSFLTFGTTRVVGRQPYTPAVFTPEEFPGTHFQGLSRPQGTWFCWEEPRKKSLVTPPGIDPGTSRLVAQCLNHYAIPDHTKEIIILISELLAGPFVLVFLPVRKIMLKVWFLSTSCECGFLHCRKRGVFVWKSFVNVKAR